MSAAQALSWGDVAARLRPFIRGKVASEADADDVLQEVLLRVHRGIDGLADDDRLGPWMFRIARRAVADHVRARLRHQPTGAPQADVAIERAAALAAEARERDAEADEAERAANALAASLSHFVAALDSPYREAIVLTELEGRTQKEAAERMGVSLSGAKSRVQRGRAKLRALLLACCDVALDARGKVVACAPKPDGAAPDDCCC